MDAVIDPNYVGGCPPTNIDIAEIPALSPNTSQTTTKVYRSGLAVLSGGLFIDLLKQDYVLSTKLRSRTKATLNRGDRFDIAIPNEEEK
jgi:hypothetical protein